MANRKLSIGCVLVMGGALTNCGGTVETRGDGTGNEHGGAPGSGGSGYVGVPVTTGGFMGTCCPGTGGYTGAGGPGFVGGVGGGFVGVGSGGFMGVAPQGGRGGNAGAAGQGDYFGVGGQPEAGFGGESWDGVVAGAGGVGGDDGI